MVYDSELAIAAGSDTTTTTLAATLFLLAQHPEKQKLLQEEIDHRIESIEGFSVEKLAGAPILDGCINEALRLYPPVPSGVQRVTPAGGAVIAGRWLPGNVFVSTPTYTIHRGS